MDVFSSFFESQSGYSGVSPSSSSCDSLKNLGQISPAVQSHLKQVYFTLCSALVTSAVGSYLHILFDIGGYLTWIGCIGFMAWLLSTPPYEEQKRVWLLMAAAVLEGASIGPMVNLPIDIDPRVLVIAFVGCATAFGCFFVAAMLARRRVFFYLGALVSSGICILCWLHLASSLFGGSSTIFRFEVFLCLSLFLGIIVYETDKIIEEAHLGDSDVMKHVLTLFNNFIALFR